MLGSLLIVFREVLEGGLIVGIIMAATVGIAHRMRAILGGIAVGVIGAALLAVFAGQLSDALQGTGQELFNATILVVAAVMLGWHNIWMATHGREMAKRLQSVGAAVAEGEQSLLALAVVVAVAVLREGSEVVLFLYGIATSDHSGTAQIATGGVLGVACGVLLSWLIYRGLLAIPLRNLFRITNVLIALLAAGMAGRAAAILAESDLAPAWGYQIWDTSWLVSDGTLLGRALQALFGYAAQPMGIQLAAWLFTLLIITALAHLLRAADEDPAKTGPALK